MDYNARYQGDRYAVAGDSYLLGPKVPQSCCASAVDQVSSQQVLLRTHALVYVLPGPVYGHSNCCKWCLCPGLLCSGAESDWASCQCARWCQHCSHCYHGQHLFIVLLTTVNFSLKVLNLFISFYMCSCGLESDQEARPSKKFYDRPGHQGRVWWVCPVLFL